MEKNFCPTKNAVEITKNHHFWKFEIEVDQIMKGGTKNLENTLFFDIGCT